MTGTPPNGTGASAPSTGAPNDSASGGSGGDASGSAPQPFRDVELPDGSDPIEKGIVRRVRHDDGVVTVDVAIEGLGDSLAERIVEQIRGAALTMPEADHVRVLPITHEDKDVELPTVDHVIAVASAKGGVGKTTVSVAVARALSERGLDVGLFDADIYGPNVPHVLADAEGPVLTNGSGQPVPVESNGIRMLSPGIVGGDPPTARRGSIAYGAVENLLGQGAWGDRDVMIIDMPAGSDDVVGAALEHVPVDGVVLVTTPFDASVDDTRRTLELFEENGVSPVAGVVNMSGFTCDCCGELNELFDDDVDLDVPALHELPFDHELQRDPGKASHEAISGVAGSVESYVDEVLEAVPEDAVDVRELPTDSQLRQLADEVAFAEPGDAVRAAVDDPRTLKRELREATSGIVGEVSQVDLATTGALLEIERIENERVDDAQIDDAQIGDARTDRERTTGEER